MKVHVINGPNLNLLGTREPEIYGHETLDEINRRVADHAKQLGIDPSFAQSNVEGEIVNELQQADRDCAAIVINPGAYTHTSLAIADAIRAISAPVIEVHLSNIHARGRERARSVTATAARGLVCGFGADGYLLAMDAIPRVLKS